MVGVVLHGVSAVGVVLSAGGVCGGRGGAMRKMVRDRVGGDVEVAKAQSGSGGGALEKRGKRRGGGGGGNGEQGRPATGPSLIVPKEGLRWVASPAMKSGRAGVSQHGHRDHGGKGIQVVVIVVVVAVALVVLAVVVIVVVGASTGVHGNRDHREGVIAIVSCPVVLARPVNCPSPHVISAASDASVLIPTPLVPLRADTARATP